MNLSEHIATESMKAYIARFEHEFADYVDQLAGIVVVGNPGDAKPVVQQLVNAYRSANKWGAVEIPRFNTLMMLIKITGASEQHSGKTDL